MKTIIIGKEEWLAAVKRRGRRKSKYNAIRITVDGRKYDSKREAEIGCELELQRKAGQISTIEFQKVFELIPSPNRVTYRADFFVTYPDGRQEVIDAKGVETAVFKIKAKMFRHLFPHIPLVTRK